MTNNHTDKRGKQIHPTGSAASAQKTGYTNYILGLLMLAYIFSYVDRQILSLMVGPIRSDLDISDFEISLLQGWAFALFYSVMAIPIARMADNGSRVRIISIGVALWSTMTALSGLARSFGALFAMRVGVGVGEAALTPATYSMLSDYFSREKLPRALAIYMLGIPLGSGLAYIFGGAVVEAATSAPPVVIPHFGRIAPWQLTFIIVGLPGLIVAALIALTVREPARRGTGMSKGDVESRLPFMEVFRFQLKRWRVYIGISMGTAQLGILSYGTLAWYPTFLMRTYGTSVAETGLYFGLIYIVFGSLGTIIGVRIAGWIVKKGYRDGHIRFLIITSILLVIPATIGPLMPTAFSALLVLAPAIFLKNSHHGSSSSVLQVITPNRMRAQVTAVQIFLNNIIGLTVGASAIAILTDFVFVDDYAIRYSMAWVAGVTCPLAAIILWTCLKPYRASLEESKQWEN